VHFPSSSEQIQKFGFVQSNTGDASLPSWNAIALVSEWLGHENLETSLIYVQADTEMKREAILKATGSDNPLNIEKNQCYWKDDDELIRKLYGLK
jgi:hypothetical protein